MKSLKMLWRETAEELAVWCRTSTRLDYKKLEARVEHEGMSFLTITLPSFGKDFERSLDQSYVDPNSFHGFSRKGGLPRFLGGFLDQVFDRRTGLLLSDPSHDAVFAIRQLTLMFGKIEIPCSDTRVSQAMRRFVECEQEVGQADEVLSESLLQDFSDMSALLWSDVLSYMDKLVYDGNVVPKHGPGATADKLTGNRKYDQIEWPERLERVFPFGDYALPSWRYYNQLDHVNFLEPDAERPVRVISVPKTLKTPRIIAIEPTCMQYMQQALLNPLVEMLESHSVPGNTRQNVSCSLVGFSDQNPNRDLAREGSISGSLATLDLSEASDRVSNQHVLALLARWPHFSEAVQATRSTKADVLLDGNTLTVPLKKFASMGSALCFPMEAMVFTTIVFLAIQSEHKRQLTRADVFNLHGRVRVYGDDIIVPTDYVRPVIDHLEAFGYRVNVNKSFWNGNFRESCGGDYYEGTDVTPVRFRRVFPRSRADAQEVISLVEFRNHMYSRGLWKTARYLDDKIVRVLPHFPIVSDTSPALGRKSFSFSYETERLCDALHRPLVKAYVQHSRPPASKASGEGALLKYFLKKGREPFQDEKHLERQGRPSAVGIKLRWIPPF